MYWNNFYCLLKKLFWYQYIKTIEKHKKIIHLNQKKKNSFFFFKYKNKHTLQEKHDMHYKQ